MELYHCLLYTSIPYGTKLYITSTDGKFVYGYAVATDTGLACLLYTSRCV